MYQPANPTRILVACGRLSRAGVKIAYLHKDEDVPATIEFIPPTVKSSGH